MTEGDKARWLAERMLTFVAAGAVTYWLAGWVNGATGLLAGVMVGWWACVWVHARGWFDAAKSRGQDD